MILDYEYSRDKKQFSISFIREDGNKEILHFDNIQKFLTYYYTPEGRFKTWDDARCDTKYTYNPSKFDLKEFIYNLGPEIQAKLDGKTFPKLYTFDIETRLKSGPNGEIGQGDFTDPVDADEPIHTISLVSPNLNSVVMGDKPLSEEDIEWIKNQFYQYLNSIPFYRTLNIQTPEFRYMYFDSEERMLQFFMEKVVAKVPVLAGWNSIGYDWCYITNRIKNYFTNISVASGSATGTVRPKKFTNKKGEDINLLHPTHTLILDMMEVIETEDTQVLPMKESMNLDYISHEVLGANKVEYEGNLEELYIKDYRRYVFYNLIDSILVQLNDKKFKTMDHIYMYSLYAKERIGQCFSKIALTEALILKHFRTTNTKIVWQSQEQIERGRLLGAYVKKPLGGRYEFVCCNDFASLYPSTMRTCNLSFENYVGAFWDDDALYKYRHDPDGYVVVGPNVFINEGTALKPSMGDQVGTFLDDKALEPYRKDKNYFVTVNGCVYKNDKDYTLRLIMESLYNGRNASKYLSKDLDAMVISDIDHIFRGIYTEFHTYKQNAIDLIRDLGYDFTCGADIKNWFGYAGPDALKEFERKIKTEITYHANLEQAIKLMMNSVYGGTSHKAFYWFNINLANDITGESRNLTHMMEDHLGEYWKTAWQTEPKLIELQKKLGLKIKADYEIKDIISRSPCQSLCTIVYGDSVSGDSRIKIRYKSCVTEMTIQDLYDMCKEEYGIIGVDNHGSEHIHCPYEALNYKGNQLVWSPIKDIISHKVKKQKWILKSKSGKSIEVTSDHSLVVFRNNKQITIKPNEIKTGDKILIIK